MVKLDELLRRHSITLVNVDRLREVLELKEAEGKSNEQ